MKTNVIVNKRDGIRILEVTLDAKCSRHIDEGGLISLIFNSNGQIAWAREVSEDEIYIRPKDDSV